MGQILRFRSRDGTARVEVDPNDDIAVISLKVLNPPKL